MTPRLLCCRPLLACLLALGSASAALAAPLPDKNLEAALREALREPASKELKDDDFNRVYVLEAVGKNIQNLAGLEKCKNLTLLRLSKNQITDVKPLAGLKNLQSLDLADNKIADVAPLAGLEGLQYLELSNNKVADIKPLAGLQRLNALYLSGNQVKDVAPLAKLDKLWSLYLARNPLPDVGPIAGLKRVSTLDLSDTPIAKVDPVAQLPELNLVLLERTKIADLGPLVAAATKDAAGPKRFAPFLRLYLAGCPLSPEARSQQVPALRKAGVRVFGVDEAKK